MKLSARSELADVAIAVGDTLRRSGIRAVLTGGACANLYSDGAYRSLDADFVLLAHSTTEALDRAMATLGFMRRKDRYVHPRLPFFVEFPRGPLGIGGDSQVRPVLRGRGAQKTLALSATDACRDRLAAYYHWGDRQSLEVAVSIARRNRISLRKIHEWSRSEGHLDKHAEFIAAVTAERKPRRGST